MCDYIELIRPLVELNKEPCKKTKRIYPSETHVQAAILRTGNVLYYYWCRDCVGFHITKKKNKKSRQFGDELKPPSFWKEIRNEEILNTVNMPATL